MRGKMMIVALAAVMAISGWAMAATSASVSIKFTVEFLAISVDTTDWAVGMVAAGASKQPADAITITNTGNIAEKFSAAQRCTTDLTAGTTLTGDTGPKLNQYVLATKVADTAPDMDTGYADADVIPGSDAPPADPTLVTIAASVAKDASVKLWPLLKVPTSVDSAHKGEHEITLTISCAKP
jgi:hypothetical protein